MKNHYYPFGLKHTNYNSDQLAFRGQNEAVVLRVAAPSSPVPVFGFAYKYNGKEFQDELNLNWYDYGARNYDPAIGRYFSIDNFSESFHNMSQYQYAANNPVKFIDVNGDYIYIYDSGNKYRYENGKIYSQNNENNKWDVEVTAQEGSYVAQILGALNDITGDDENSFGSKYLGLFANDDINVTIQENTSSAKGIKDRNATQGTNIYTSFKQKEKTPTTSGSSVSPFHIILAHELAHGLANNLLSDIELKKTWIAASTANGLSKDLPQSEIFATMYENMIRAEQGLPLRTHYSPKDDGSVVEESRLIKKSNSKNPFSKAYNPTEGVINIWNNLIKSKKK